MDNTTLIFTLVITLSGYVIAAYCLFALLIVLVKEKLFKHKLHKTRLHREELKTQVVYVLESCLPNCDYAEEAEAITDWLIKNDFLKE